MKAQILGLLLSLSLILSVAGCAGASLPQVEAKRGPDTLDFSGFRVIPDKVYLTSGLEPGSQAWRYAVPGENLDHPEYNWKVGDPLAVQIHSAYDHPAKFRLQVEMTTGPTVDKSTGITYDPAPAFVLDWLQMEKEVEVPPKSILRVPVMLRVPDDVPAKLLGLIPNRAEFRIRVYNVDEYSKPMMTDVLQRWLITTR